MHNLDAFLLGLVQGFTEFFPISSSAHLKFVKMLLGLEASHDSPSFDLACHLGTLITLIYFLRKDIRHLFLYDRKKLLMLFLSLTPLIPFYFLLKPLRDMASTPSFLGFFLIVTAGILFIGNKIQLKKIKDPISKGDFFLIGTMQAIALIPGISRSGSTIATARALGWSAREAVRFSFLLSIPAILGGTCLEALKLVREPATLLLPASVYVIGFSASFLGSLSIVSFAIRLLEKGTLKPFFWYCLIVGILITLYTQFK
jgi:undecaprenyl-diphosphatase